MTRTPIPLKKVEIKKKCHATTTTTTTKTTTTKTKTKTKKKYTRNNFRPEGRGPQVQKMREGERCTMAIEARKVR